MSILIILGLLVLLVAVGITSYNRLVALRNRFRNAFAQIDVQLKRRYDLIPNLVETAKGYLAHERETLEGVIKARNQAVRAEKRASESPGSPEVMQALQGAETMLQGALSRFFALSEAYPDLKADRTMRDLMEELRTTENRISFARQSYNDAVMTYNTARESFPAVIFAAPMGFREAELFEVESFEERETPRVSFQ
jgi:LemA protein